MLLVWCTNRLNDVEMLQQVGHGVAVSNACHEAKAAAAVTSTYSNAESAVARECAALIRPGRLGAAI